MAALVRRAATSPLPAFQLILVCARLTHASESVYMGSNSNDIEQIKVQ